MIEVIPAQEPKPLLDAQCRPTKHPKDFTGQRQKPRDSRLDGHYRAIVDAGKYGRPREREALASQVWNVELGYHLPGKCKCHPKPRPEVRTKDQGRHYVAWSESGVREAMLLGVKDLSKVERSFIASDAQRLDSKFVREWAGLADPPKTQRFKVKNQRILRRRKKWEER